MAKTIELPEGSACILITQEEEGTAFQVIDNEVVSSEFNTFNIAQGLAYIAVTDPEEVIASYYSSIKAIKNNNTESKVLDFETGEEIEAPAWSKKIEGEG